MNAVACEIPIIATGARPVGEGEQRELFTEETSTALVFENGGVLKLAAAVAPGQLLFLTHKETKREVVAQVTRKRDFRPMMCYVEVEFSEPAQGFWGIEFPKVPETAPAPASAHAPQKMVDEPPQMQEYILADEPAEPTAAPSAEEISALKDEVEVLREQLKLLQTQMVTGNSPVTEASPELSRATAPEPPQVPAEVTAPAPVVARAPGEQLLKSLSGPGEAAHGAPTEIASALPRTHPAPPPPTEAAETPFNEEDLLPKPAPDFKSAKPPATLAAEPKHKVAAASGSATMRKDLLFAAFVIITAGAAWYQNLLPWMSHSKNASPNVVSGGTAHPVPHAPQKAANAQADEGKPPQAGEAAKTPASASTPDTLQAAQAGTPQPAAGPVPETPVAGKPTRDAPVDAAPAVEKSVVAASAGKRSPVASLSKAAMVSEVPPADDTAVVPPKLIKSVKAIASPNALQDFGGGTADNVTFDALVDASGHVKSVKALSGPPALRNPAMEALKKYVYEPATKHGKPVPAHVTVTVKFLFEP